MNIEKDTRKELINDFDKLVKLAEEVSRECEEYQEKILALKFQILLVLSILTLGLVGVWAYFSSHIQKSNLILVTFISIASMLILLIYIANIVGIIRKKRENFRREYQVLLSLLDSIDAYRINTNEFMTNFEITYFDMRLNRIKFSFKRREKIMITSANNA